MKPAPAALAVALAGCLAPRAAIAHDRSTSYSVWRVDGDTVHVRARVSALDLTRLDGADAAAHIASSLTASVDGAPCAPLGPPAALPDPEPGYIERAFSLRCPPGDALRIRSDLLADVAPSHVHLARVSRPPRGATEHVLVEGAREASVDLPTAPSFARFVRLGAEHVLSGPDHLAFLAALLLSRSSLRHALLVVTGFTVGHSATLALAVLGAARVDAPSVEALIGLSVALVSAENIWLASRAPRSLPLAAALSLALLAALAHALGASTALALAGMALFSSCYLALLARSPDPRRPRAAVASLFGLLHGLGFASGLASLDASGGGLVRALLGFNVGVELGQLAAVAALAAPLALLARAPDQTRSLITSWASAITLALGTFWLVSRSLAP